ncbi:MBL fold metallo-hydrolase [Metabacillus halosaccharovorans]|uniref:MBL fold metallo-hydrolase n=1 Tax=Metabacillus halosaccharovorans TaxID=930124 RepID=UPI001C1FDB50|nr:MBL fold metallo-hydrolase [Metabacillus halosaccharovorans]MBU7590950.1 MBL fold metallo-hydrolase [Metabacillus halosaccharovorans]
MKVTVIGYWGGFPNAGEATSGYLFETNGFRLLIDCGSAVLSKLQQTISIDQLDAVVLSHYHHDHVADIGPLQYGCYVTGLIHNRKKTLPIYGHDLDQAAFQKLTYKDATMGVVYKETEVLEIGPFSITFLRTTHPSPCFAMKITDHASTVIYTADTSYQDNFIPFTSNADLLISECSLYSHQDGKSAGHMNSTEVGQLAHKAKVKQLLLTHLPHFGNQADLAAQANEHFKGEINLASTGFVWDSED